MLSSKLTQKYNIIAIILSFIIFLSIPTFIHGQNVLYEQDFSINDLGRWESNAWNNWFISDGYLVGLTSSNQTVPYYILMGDYNWENYSFEVDVKAEWGVDKAIMFYIGDDGNALRFNLRSYYPGGPTEHGNDFILTERTPIGSTNTNRLVRVTDVFNITNQWYKIKAEIIHNNEGVYITGFVDDQKLIEYLDESNQYNKGKIGLEIWTGYEGERLLFDNIKVKQLENNDTQNLNLPVPNLKQYAASWGFQIYDSAVDWAANPYISDWGCALTSATMVLQFHNHNIDPGALNTWLINQPDGYIRNGLINWLAISRFSKNNIYKIDSNENIKTLEFSRSIPNKKNEQEALNIRKPIIYVVPGHFVVGRGYDEREFFVNDPASEFRNTLSEVEHYHGPHTSFIEYNPSYTDLSYIFLILNSNIDVSITNPTGSNISDDQIFIEEPIINDLVGKYFSGSGKILNSIHIPKPDVGIYHISLTGVEAKTQLDAYLYDKNGNVNFQSINLKINGDIGLILDYDNQNKFIFASNFENIIKFLKQLKATGKIKHSYYQFLYNNLVTANRHYVGGKNDQAIKSINQIILQLEKNNSTNLPKVEVDVLSDLLITLKTTLYLPVN
jgi:hypothetical protein